jgi:hypothetical protein
MDGELLAGPIVQTIFVLERLFIMGILFYNVFSFASLRWGKLLPDSKIPVNLAVLTLKEECPPGSVTATTRF